MPVIVPFAGISPQSPAWCAPDASLIGDVRFGPGCSVWFQAVLRGDINRVELGEGVNVQDGCILHVSRAKPCLIGSGSSLGHGAIAHACTVGRDCLLGMGSRVLDGVVIGDGCCIAAGAVVPEGLQVPANSLVVGVPARIVGPVKSELRERMARINLEYRRLQDAYPQFRCP